MRMTLMGSYVYTLVPQFIELPGQDYGVWPCWRMGFEVSKDPTIPSVSLCLLPVGQDV